MSAPPAINQRNTTIASILGQTASSAYSTVGSYAATSYETYATGENGNYTLQVLFYLFMYAFIIFLVLVLVHFTITPVFKFTPGAAGLIGIPASTDDKVYWKDKKQPLSEDCVPKEADNLASYDFINNFSFSLDLYVRKIADTNANARVILYKTFRYGNDLSTPIASPLTAGPASTDVLERYMSSRSSMYMYLTDTNDLGVTFFCSSADGTGTPYSIKQIANIPFYTPFRITCVVENKTFTVYLNGKQTFQRIVPSAITLNSSFTPPAGVSNTNQRFYAPPAWADSPTKTIFLQNFHIWPRAITYAEVQQAQPALARKEDFGMSKEAGSTSCS